MICIALFATAATIIGQIIHTYNPIARYALPVIGYLAAVLTVIYGLELYARSCHGKQFRGRTRDLRSRFHHSLCSYHSHSLHPLHPHSRQLGTYRPATTCRCIQFLPGIYPDSSCHPYGSNGMDMGLLAIVKSSEHNAYYVAGHVMAGLACICSSQWRWLQPSSARYATTIQRLNGNNGRPLF